MLHFGFMGFLEYCPEKIDQGLVHELNRLANFIGGKFKKTLSFFFVYFYAKSIKFLLQFFVDIFTCKSRFVDPDPGRKKVADPTDPDPQH